MRLDGIQIGASSSSTGSAGASMRSSAATRQAASRSSCRAHDVVAYTSLSGLAQPDTASRREALAATLAALAIEGMADAIAVYDDLVNCMSRAATRPGGDATSYR
jgi:hypothetical protein